MLDLQRIPPQHYSYVKQSSESHLTHKPTIPCTPLSGRGGAHGERRKQVLLPLLTHQDKQPPWKQTLTHSSERRCLCEGSECHARGHSCKNSVESKLCHFTMVVKLCFLLGSNIKTLNVKEATNQEDCLPQHCQSGKEQRREGEERGDSSGVDSEIASPQGRVIPGQKHANAKVKGKEKWSCFTHRE